MDGNKANATSGLWNVRVLLVLAIAVAGSIVGCEGTRPGYGGLRTDLTSDNSTCHASDAYW